MADRLDFEIDVELETGLITGHAGVPGLIEAFRQTGTAAVIDREIKLKRRKRGLSASEMVESLLAMWAAGGERAEDLDQFRQDKALALLLNHELPAAQTASATAAAGSTTAPFWRESAASDSRAKERAIRPILLRGALQQASAQARAANPASAQAANSTSFQTVPG